MPGDEQDWRLANVRDIHLGDAQEGDHDARQRSSGRSSPSPIVAFLILGMACVNFTNLATARASQRAREVALRKVLGANRQQLVAQFLGGIDADRRHRDADRARRWSSCCCRRCPASSMPTLRMTYFGADGMLLPILVLILLVGAAGGLYPAFYLSRFQPAQVLKANKSSAEASGSGLLRNVLVVAQFAVSIGLIICTAVVYAQTVYARTADPGYRRDGLIQIENIGRRQLIERAECDRRGDGARSPASSRSAAPASASRPRTTRSTGVQVPGQAEPVDDRQLCGRSRLLRDDGNRAASPADCSTRTVRPTMTMPFRAATRAGERALVARGINVVINELAARRMGFAQPGRGGRQDGHGQLFRSREHGCVPTDDHRRRPRYAASASIREPIDPIMFRSTRTLPPICSSATKPRSARRSARPGRADLEATRARRAVRRPSSARTSSPSCTRPSGARARSSPASPCSPIIIACLGLFGLAAFTAERRTKEIGIRKVLGARTRDIVRLLAWQFSKPVIVANLIAWPVAWWVMRDWLNTFDTRIDLGPTPFVLAGLLALGHRRSARSPATPSGWRGPTRSKR